MSKHKPKSVQDEPEYTEPNLVEVLKSELPYLTTPDSVFRFFFRNIQIAKAFLRHYAPKDLLDAIDLDTLEIVESAYVDTRFKDSFADVVLKCKAKNAEIDYYFTILLEHKSKQPDLIHVQLLDYIHHVWELNRKAKERLSFPLTFVVHNGPKKWVFQRMKDYFPGVSKKLLRLLPSFDYFLIDLSRLSLGKLNNIDDATILRNIFIALKFADDSGQLMKHCGDIVRISASQRSDPMTYELMQNLCQFIAQKVPDEQGDVLQQTLSKNLTDQDMISVYDRIVMNAEAAIAPKIAAAAAETQAANALAKANEAKAAKAKAKAAKAKAEAAKAKANEAKTKAEALKAKAEATVNLLDSCPEWSDSKIAEVLGTSVADVRKARAKGVK